MGRHRRVPHAPEPTVEVGRAEVDDDHGRRGSHRKRSSAPVRTGLLGASAAMAMGAVAVASGLIPGPAGMGGDGGYGGRVQADGPTDLESQGVPSSMIPTPSSSSPGHSSGSPQHDGDGKGDGGGKKSTSPSHPRDTQRPSRPSAPSRSSRTPDDGSGTGRTGGAHPTRTDSGSSGHSEGPNPESTVHHGTTASATPDSETSAEREVLSLVNQQRSKAGCQPVTASTKLARLAGNFSQEMDTENFFSHTSPDGKTPWDRAKALGITDLGGENIARGQANAQSVMDSWMHSPGHKANILNCQYHTLGVGAHFADGGPWWTQDFGF